VDRYGTLVEVGLNELDPKRLDIMELMIGTHYANRL
jgi:hypothetical protein